MMAGTGRSNSINSQEDLKGLIKPCKTLKLPCVAHIWTGNAQETADIIRALEPLLRPADPNLCLVSVGDNCLNNAGTLEQTASLVRHHIKNKVAILNTSPEYYGKLSTPSLAFVLMLKEKGDSYSSAEDQVQHWKGSSHSATEDQVKYRFNEPPWRFHHKIELSNTKGGQIRSIAKQEFYQPGPSLPLCAVCPIHFGNQSLRYTIFTRNFSAMIDFYRILTGKEVEHVRPANFCLFELYMCGSTSVQLALKRSNQPQPTPSSSCTLIFRTTSPVHLQTLLGIPVDFVTDSLYLLHDPDGNVVLLEQISEASVVQPKQGVYCHGHVSQSNRHVTQSNRHNFQSSRTRGYSSYDWSETSSYDSGQNSSSFNSFAESAISDVDSCIADMNFGELLPNHYQSKRKTAPVIHYDKHITDVTPTKGITDKETDYADQKPPVRKSCKAWEISPDSRWDVGIMGLTLNMGSDPNHQQFSITNL